MTELSPEVAAELDRIRAMSDDERRWFLMWLSGYKAGEFMGWLDQWQAGQVDPSPVAAAAEVPADLAPIPPRRRDETPGERMNRIDATADALAYLAKTRRQGGAR